MDECHLISEWAGFRDSFLRIPKAFRRISDAKKNSKIPVLLLSATISPAQMRAIDSNFKACGFNLQRLVFDVFRPNIFIRVESSTYRKEAKYKQTLDILNLWQQKAKQIVYCRSKQKNEELCSYLNKNGRRCGVYHASINNKEKQLVSFQQGVLNTITATVAFGMGVNIPDVRGVICVDFCKSISEAVQKIGRAGRDQKNALGTLLFSQQDAVEYMRLVLRDRQLSFSMMRRELFQVVELI